MSHVLGPGTLVAALVLALMVVPAPTAAASCAEPVPIQEALDEARAVFVGTVTGLDFGDRVARFQVDEVWKGEVGATAVVNGGPSLSDLYEARSRGEEIFTSVDRTYQAGGRYLVVSTGVDSGMFTDDGCSRTQLYAPELDRHRPAGAYTPVPASPPAGDAGGLGLPAVIGLGTAGLVAAGSVVLLARRWRRRVDWPAT